MNKLLRLSTSKLKLQKVGFIFLVDTVLKGILTDIF